jgi:transposase
MRLKPPKSVSWPKATKLPYDCKQRAQMIAMSWEGLRTGEIACHLRCHPQTVRERFERFRTEGIDGLTNRPGAGRKARLTE